MNIAELETKATRATQRVLLAKARAQERCKHPYASLTFRPGATTSYLQNGTVEHSMHVVCSDCGAWFANKLVIEKDVY